MKTRGRPPTAYGPVDQWLADVFAEAWDRRAGLPSDVRLPSTMRAVRKALGDPARFLTIGDRAKPKQSPPMPGSRIERVLALRSLVDTIAGSLGLDGRYVVGGARDEAAVSVRDKVAWALRYGCGASFPTIGLALGRDHSSVMSAVARAEARMVPGEGERLLAIVGAAMRGPCADGMLCSCEPARHGGGL